jgi:hypothetical protein
MEVMQEYELGLSLLKIASFSYLILNKFIVSIYKLKAYCRTMLTSYMSSIALVATRRQSMDMSMSFN